jgi:hypothetical protein
MNPSGASTADAETTERRSAHISSRPWFKPLEDAEHPKRICSLEDDDRDLFAMCRTYPHSSS